MRINTEKRAAVLFRGCPHHAPRTKLQQRQLFHVSTSKSLHARELNYGIFLWLLPPRTYCHCQNFIRHTPPGSRCIYLSRPIHYKPEVASAKENCITSYLERSFKLNQGGLPLKDLEKHSLEIKLSPSAPPLDRGGAGGLRQY